MIYRVRQFTLFLFFYLTAYAQNSMAAQQVEASPKFFSAIDSPSHVRICNGSLWAYSVLHRSLNKLDLTSGKKLEEIPLKSTGISGALTALGCRNDSLVIGEFKRVKENKPDEIGAFTLAIPNTPHPSHSKAKPVTLAGHGLIRDISCAGNTCYVLRDELFRSDDLKNWMRIAVPRSHEIPSVGAHSDVNPFHNWQDKFDMAKGRYFRILPKPNSKKELFLLDPLRSAIVTWDGTKATRWGKWGTWEGRIMTPRGFVLAGSKAFAISDVGVKLVSFFSITGEYLGIMGNQAEFFRFEYPMDLAMHNGIIYVADLKGDKVSAFQVFSPGKDELRSRATNHDLTRWNLLRDPKAFNNYSETRCYICHDGLLKYTLENFILANKRQHHYKTTKHKLNIQMKDGNKIECKTCHDQHHSPKSGYFVNKYGEKTALSKAASNLRKPVPELCFECHPERGNPESNHFNFKGKTAAKIEIEIRSCLQCHGMHNENDKLLQNKEVELCTSCHTDTQIPTNHPFGAEPKFELHDHALSKSPYQEVRCSSCHNPHGSSKSVSFARVAEKAPKEGACRRCHKGIVESEGINVHLSYVVPEKPHAWISSEQACLECHNPHKPKRTIIELCTSCHNQKKQVHSSKITISDTDLAIGVKLDKDKISCRTCHKLHNKLHADPTEKAILVKFCASCHGQLATQLFDEYHRRLSEPSNSK